VYEYGNSHCVIVSGHCLTIDEHKQGQEFSYGDQKLNQL